MCIGQHDSSIRPNLSIDFRMNEINNDTFSILNKIPKPSRTIFNNELKSYATLIQEICFENSIHIIKNKFVH